jgi:hypothetical protein
MLAASVCGCAPAVQDARMLPRGDSEVTVSVSPTYATFVGQTHRVATTLAVQEVIGISDRVNFGVGYGRVLPVAGTTGGAPGVNIVAFGPKFGLVPAKVAFGVPLSFAFGGGVSTSDSLELHPTALFTWAASPRVDVNPSIGALVPFCKGCSTLMRLNLGVGIASASRKVVVRPEFGLIIHPGDSGAFWMFGVGVSIRPKP